MVTQTVRYEGDLRCVAVHGPSGVSLSTDAPTDNMGKGESFSPTDLVATALATCALTTMAISARNHDIRFEGATATVTKEMIKTPVRRIGRLALHIRLPYTLPDDQRARLERAAHVCPVHQSLHPDIDAPITFEWAAA